LPANHISLACWNMASLFGVCDVATVRRDRLTGDTISGGSSDSIPSVWPHPFQSPRGKRNATTNPTGEGDAGQHLALGADRLDVRADIGGGGIANHSDPSGVGAGLVPAPMVVRPVGRRRDRPELKEDHSCNFKITTSSCFSLNLMLSASRKDNLCRLLELAERPGAIFSCAFWPYLPPREKAKNLFWPATNPKRP